MNDSLQKIVEKAIKVAEKTGEFVIEQAPLLVQEFYAYHIVRLSFTLITLISIIVILIWGINKIKRFAISELKKDSEWGGGIIIGFMILSAIVIFILIEIYSTIHELIFILTAPKLYLIDYFMQLTK